MLARPGGRPAILMYHRIATPSYDPWGLCVSPERFREQLPTLARERVVLSMDALAAALETGSAPRFATALTFDDGYADNFTIAKPMLEEIGLPATIFLTTGALGSARPFWWDELADLVFRTRAAAAFECVVGNARLTVAWPAWDALPGWLKAWRVARGSRCARTGAYVALWQALQPLSSQSRGEVMEALRAKIGMLDIPADGDSAVLSAEMVQGLASDRIGVGGHARTHVPLTALPAEGACEEIAGGRDDVAALTGAYPSGFAYPHGAHDAALAAMVAKAGYKWAVTTEADTIDAARADPYRLPRLAVGDWGGPELLRRIARHGG